MGCLKLKYYSELTFAKSKKSVRKDYMFGFNGQEKVNEIAGVGNHNTALFWEYDTRLGRRWNLDPKPNATLSSYAVYENNPLLYLDRGGDTISISLFSKTEKSSFKNWASKSVKDQKNDGYFMVFSHANPVGILFDNLGDHQTTNNAKEIIDKLCKLNPDLDKAIKNKCAITLDLQGCYTAAKKYCAPETNGAVWEYDPIAFALSKYLADINPKSKVIAYDGFCVLHTLYNQTKLAGIANCDHNGGQLIIKNGKQLNKTVIGDPPPPPQEVKAVSTYGVNPLPAEQNPTPHP
jgi:hypothetical protein